MSEEESPYAARPAPESFDDFMAQLAAVQDAHGALTLDADLYEDIFGEAPTGARAEFVRALPRPGPAELRKAEADCPVCLQSLAAIETEEEYALASESFFGDTEALGLRKLPCEGAHVVCARCCKSWLRLNNTCPLCRAPVDPHAPTSHPLIDQQRHTEQMLALFHAVFGPRAGAGAAGAGSGASDQSPHPGFPGLGAVLGGGAGGMFGSGLGGGGGGQEREREEDRSAFAGMYS